MGLHAMLVKELAEAHSENASLSRECEAMSAVVAECQEEINLLRLEISTSDRYDHPEQDSENLELKKKLSEALAELQATKLELFIARETLLKLESFESKKRTYRAMTEDLVKQVDSSKAKVYRDAAGLLLEFFSNQCDEKQGMPDEDSSATVQVDFSIMDDEDGNSNKDKSRFLQVEMSLVDRNRKDSNNDFVEADDLARQFKADVSALVEKANLDVECSVMEPVEIGIITPV